MISIPPLLFDRVRRIQIIQINHPKPQNPINDAIREAICEALDSADRDPEVAAIVLTGGVSRSFSAGGDFKEVMEMKSPQLVQAWIDHVFCLYTSVLAVTKPVVMAIDGYAIGLGLQLALMGDWRVASEGGLFSMWELKGGVACTVGACILDHCLGRHAATRLVYGADLLSGSDALQIRLVDDLVPAADLLQRAVERAEQFASYPSVPFATTKKSINARLLEELRKNREASIQAHVESFGAGSSLAHMRGVLKQ